MSQGAEERRSGGAEELRRAEGGIEGRERSSDRLCLSEFDSLGRPAPTGPIYHTFTRPVATLQGKTLTPKPEKTASPRFEVRLSLAHMRHGRETHHPKLASFRGS